MLESRRESRREARRTFIEKWSPRNEDPLSWWLKSPESVFWIASYRMLRELLIEMSRDLLDLRQYGVALDPVNSSVGLAIRTLGEAASAEQNEGSQL